MLLIMNHSCDSSSRTQVLAWVRFPTSDVDATVAFFKELGYSPLESSPTDAVLLGPGGHTIKLLAVPRAELPALPLVGLRVDSVGNALAAAVQAGAEVVLPAQQDQRGARWAHVRLPGGALLDFTSRPLGWPAEVR
jgi:catechol 2,3-dioxygenase-like lactoylglutathione lyase family enzyme